MRKNKHTKRLDNERRFAAMLDSARVLFDKTRDYFKHLYQHQRHEHEAHALLQVSQRVAYFEKANDEGPVEGLLSSPIDFILSEVVSVTQTLLDSLESTQATAANLINIKKQEGELSHTTAHVLHHAVKHAFQPELLQNALPMALTPQATNQDEIHNSIAQLHPELQEMARFHHEAYLSTINAPKPAPSSSAHIDDDPFSTALTLATVLRLFSALSQEAVSNPQFNVMEARDFSTNYLLTPGLLSPLCKTMQMQTARLNALFESNGYENVARQLQRHDVETYSNHYGRVCATNLINCGLFATRPQPSAACPAERDDDTVGLAR